MDIRNTLDQYCMILFGTALGITNEVIDKSTLMQFVAQDLGIGLAAQWIKNISPGGLAFIPFMPTDASMDMYIAFIKNGNYLEKHRNRASPINSRYESIKTTRFSHTPQYY